MLAFSYNTYYLLEPLCYHNSWKFYDFYLMCWYTWSLRKYIQKIVVIIIVTILIIYDSRDDFSGSSDYVYDSRDDYSDSSDSYNSSFVDDRELDDYAHCSDDQENIYTKYLYIIFMHNIQDILMMAIFQKQKRNCMIWNMT